MKERDGGDSCRGKGNHTEMLTTCCFKRLCR